eukprot:6537188-Prymnesium_polylepis.1
MDTWLGVALSAPARPTWTRHGGSGFFFRGRFLSATTWTHPMGSGIIRGSGTIRGSGIMHGLGVGRGWG